MKVLDMGFGIIPTVFLLLAVTLARAKNIPEERAEDCPELYKRYSSQHTYCLPPNDACTVEKRGVTAEDKELILKLHNDFRSKVATGKEENAGGLPTARNMLEMVWDDDLAAVAQKLAETCKYNHDCNNCRKVKAFSVGQNIGKGTGYSKPPEDNIWKGFITSLYNEVTRFNKKFIKPFVPGPLDPKRQYGHFTQMVWATSWKIGCGWTVYKEGNSYSSYTVCNYGPAGNVGKQELYDVGPTCSACPKNTCCGDSCKQHAGVVSNYPGLCKVIDTTKPPEGPGPHGKEYTFYCDFFDQPDCARTVKGKEWTVVKTEGGNWLSVVLQGGEKTTLEFDKEIPTKDEVCVTVLIRTGPNVDGEKESGKGVSYLDIGFFTADYELNFSGVPKSMRQNFMSHGYGLGSGGSKLKYKFEYSVPSGASPQFVEIRQVSAHDGECVL